jgi:deoxyhypusine synthase
MIVTVTLERKDFDSMHDVILEAKGYEPTDEQIQSIWNEMPDHIKNEAIAWGCSDTSFRDEMYEWLEDN